MGEVQVPNGIRCVSPSTSESTFRSLPTSHVPPPDRSRLTAMPRSALSAALFVRQMVRARFSKSRPLISESPGRRFQ